jgi:hypothetical protein
MHQQRQRQQAHGALVQRDGGAEALGGLAVERQVAEGQAQAVVHQGVVHLQGQGLEEDLHRLVQATGLEQGVALGVEEVGVARGVGRVGVEDLGGLLAPALLRQAFGQHAHVQRVVGLQVPGRRAASVAGPRVPAESWARARFSHIRASSGSLAGRL